MQEKFTNSGNFSIRLRQLIENKGYTINLFESEILGLSGGTLHKSLKKSGDIGITGLQKIMENFPDINIEWLLTGKGSIEKEEFTTPSIASEPPSPIYGEQGQATEIKRIWKTIEMMRSQDDDIADRLVKEVVRIDEVNAHQQKQIDFLTASLKG